MKRPATVSGGSSRPSGSSATERSLTRSWRKDPPRSTLDLVGQDLEAVGRDADRW